MKRSAGYKVLPLACGLPTAGEPVRALNRLRLRLLVMRVAREAGKTLGGNLITTIAAVIDNQHVAYTGGLLQHSKACASCKLAPYEPFANTKLGDPFISFTDRTLPLARRVIASASKHTLYHTYLTPEVVAEISKGLNQWVDKAIINGEGHYTRREKAALELLAEWFEVAAENSYGVIPNTNN